MCNTLIGRDVFLLHGIETLINHSRYKNAVIPNQLKIRSKEVTNFLVGTTKPKYGCRNIKYDLIETGLNHDRMFHERRRQAGVSGQGSWKMKR